MLHSFPLVSYSILFMSIHLLFISYLFPFSFYSFLHVLFISFQFHSLPKICIEVINKAVLNKDLGVADVLIESNQKYITRKCNQMKGNETKSSQPASMK